MKSFFALLDAMNKADPARKAEIERIIWDTFECNKAVLALDMSGFSLTVRRTDILSCLCQIRSMQLLTLPILHEYDGELVKYDADNILAVFDDPSKAVMSAVAMNQGVNRSNACNDSGSRISFSIGIDFGRTLHIAGLECFGDAVNIAYKLGEDIARSGEILITNEVRNRLNMPFPYELQEVALSIAGIDLLAHSIQYQAEA